MPGRWPCRCHFQPGCLLPPCVWPCNLAAVKRRQELAQTGREGRTVLQHYSVALVDRYAEMAATGALLFYSLFVMNAHPELVITIPLVLFGLFRYWFCG